MARKAGLYWLARFSRCGLRCVPIEGAPLPPLPPLPVHKGQGWAVLAICVDFVPGSASAHGSLSVLDYQERVQFILT